MRARIAVPVPGPAEVAALLDDAIVGDPRFLQPRADDQPGKPAADKGESHMIADRIARCARGIGIEGKIGELALEPLVLRGPVGAQPLVALRRIPAPQRLLVDRAVLMGRSHVPLPAAPVSIRNPSIMSRKDGIDKGAVLECAIGRG